MHLTDAISLLVLIDYPESMHCDNNIFLVSLPFSFCVSKGFVCRLCM